MRKNKLERDFAKLDKMLAEAKDNEDREIIKSMKRHRGMTFKDLAIKDAFNFRQDTDGNDAEGPYIKISALKYIHTAAPYRQIKIGSTKSQVEKVLL